MIPWDSIFPGSGTLGLGWRIDNVRLPPAVYFSRMETEEAHRGQCRYKM
jgi:hypothetical protein